MDKKKIKEILERLHSGELTEEEENIAKNWLHQLHLHDASDLNDEDLAEAHEAMWSKIEKGVAKRVIMWPKLIAAACALLFLSFGIYYILDARKTSGQLAQQQPLIVHPGGNNAVLTLTDGSKIVLDHAQNGRLARQGVVSVNKISSGKLIYQGRISKGGEAAEPVFNTITTQAGGQYQLVLADGTGVWLNALSSIRYPTTFTGKDREVELQGEAYFEVAKNKSMPFHVKSSGQSIEVLGTHFNVNAYADEPCTITTLLEGKVRVWNENRSAMLIPGQQSKLEDHTFVVSEADTRAAVAWKNGYFRFSNTALAPLMRQISRWYNVKVTYTGPAVERNFSGGIARSADIKSVILMLKYLGINASLQGDVIIIAQ